jgi:hypothetical protein
VVVLSVSPVRGASGGATEAEAEPDHAEITDAGKVPGTPTACGANANAESKSGTTPPNWQPKPAKPLRGVGT